MGEQEGTGGFPEVPQATEKKEIQEVSQEVRGLRKEDIRPEIPEKGGTILVLQVNAKDDRSDPTSPHFGELKPDAAEETVTQAEDFLNEVIRRLIEEGRADEVKNISIVVYASDAELRMPEGTNSLHQRAMETGVKVLEGLRKSMGTNEINTNQLLNDENGHKGEPVGASGLIDLQFWDRPEFVKYKKTKYGTGINFWVNYEADTEWETRVKMGAEGPIQIARRMREALAGLTVTVANQFHEANPDDILIIWAVSHYDAIAPWVSGYVLDADPRKTHIPTEKGGGITVRINRKGDEAETNMGEKIYKIPSLTVPFR